MRSTYHRTSFALINVGWVETISGGHHKNCLRRQRMGFRMLCLAVSVLNTSDIVRQIVSVVLTHTCHGVCGCS